MSEYISIGLFLALWCYLLEREMPEDGLISMTKAMFFIIFTWPVFLKLIAEETHRVYK